MSGMRKADGVRVALASLVENPLRTFLTLVGIAAGVTAVVLVVSVINGLNRYVGDTIGDLGSNAFVVNRFGIIKSYKEWVEAERRNPRIRREDAEAIRRAVPQAWRIGVQQDRSGSVRVDGQTATGVSIKGVTPEVIEIESYEVAVGSAILDYHEQNARRVVFVGHDVAASLFPNLDPIGRRVSIWGRSFIVVGVGSPLGSAFGQPRDNYVMVPLSTFEHILGTRGSVRISVQAADPTQIPLLIDQVRGVMRARHNLRPAEDDDFGVITSDSIMGFWADLTGMIFRVAIFVVSISLVVGGIVIMNIMLLSVVERTREIGIRKAIGARSTDVRFQFLVESVVLCAAGGLVGVTLGWTGTWAVRSLTPLPAAFPLWAPALAVAVTSAVGIFFGLHPARQAARLDPIEALRHEEL